MDFLGLRASCLRIGLPVIIIQAQISIHLDQQKSTSPPTTNKPTTTANAGKGVKSSDIADIIFRDPTALGRTCNACGAFVKQSKTSGYRNLLSHLERHPGYDDVMERCRRAQIPVTMDIFVDKQAHTTHGWMKLVVMKNFSFTNVDDEHVRGAVRYGSISSKTLKARMIASVEHVEPAIREELRGKKFALVFDGLTDSSEHSLAVFAVTSIGLRFLAVSTFVDEASMTADEHIRFLDMILAQYELDAKDMVAIVCDNMETNGAISKRIMVPMIGCAAHHFNLAVKEHVSDKKKIIEKISILIASSRL